MFKFQGYLNSYHEPPPYRNEPPPYRIESPWLPDSTSLCPLPYSTQTSALYHTVHKPLPSTAYSTQASAIQYMSLCNTVHTPLQYSTRTIAIQYTRLCSTVHEPLQYSTRASVIQNNFFKTLFYVCFLTYF